MPRGGSRKGSGRKSGWNHSETQTIRVPAVFAEQLTEIAKALDDAESFDLDTESKNTTSGIKLCDQKDLEKIAQEILLDLTVTRNGKDKGAAKRALEAMIKQLSQS